MDIDQYRAPQREQVPTDYWDLPEVAALLHLVTHINIGGTVALCLWVAMLAFGGSGSPMFTLDIPLITQGRHDCRCEQMVLVPLSERERQIAHINIPSRS
ncbi:MAG: hypothetical protein ABL891_03565 [Burkholderiales bacterium]